ncbi:MAG: hypothetical protein ACE5OR_17280, partial [bacterium]
NVYEEDRDIDAKTRLATFEVCSHGNLSLTKLLTWQRTYNILECVVEAGNSLRESDADGHFLGEF